MRGLSVAALICFVAASGVQRAAAQGSKGSPKIDRMYVFGDSYSDIGEGYLDGNGPTAVAYFAERLGFKLWPSNTPDVGGKSLDYAVSGAKSGAGAGHDEGGFRLGYGMKNQVDDFAAKVRSGGIKFRPESTLFFIAGGLNDKTEPEGFTVKNEEGEMRTLYGLGARRFMVALMPTLIPNFADVGKRLNPQLEKIPAEMTAELKGARISLSHWGGFFDAVMRDPRKYGITNTTDPCAGREIRNEDTTPCAAPETYFYFHHSHPSTVTHKAVGGMMYDEVMGAK